MTLKALSLTRLIHYIQSHKIKSILIVAGAVCALAYSLAFFIPKQVVFSYAGDTCVRQLTILPSIHQADSEAQVSLRFKNTVKLGSVPLASTTTCFTAEQEPKRGDIRVGTSPFGGIIAKKQFILGVQSAPTANLSNFEEPVPVTKAIDITMSQPDAVFTYALNRGGDSAPCNTNQQGLACDVPALRLKQGKQYQLALTRQFKSGPKTVIAKKEVKTLRAVTITKTSIKNDQTVYVKPISFNVSVDKPLVKANARFEMTGKKTAPIAVKTKVDGMKLTVTWPEQLKRETTYRLILTSVEAADGSTLVEPKAYRFSMSGGPKVIASSVGASKVLPGAPITLTFDQPIADNSAAFASIGGIAASSAKTSSKTVTLTPTASPRCQDFNVVVKKGIKSKYGIVATSGWTQASRTLCQSVATIGVSLQGRAIQSYSFGSSGPVTLFTGAIHGSESSSAGMMRSLIDYLESKGNALKNRVVVVPEINPDGVAAGTRNNSRNVNVSRNFPTDNWQRDIDDTNGKVKNGGGTKPLSEPEARAIANLTTALKPRLLVSYHAVGSLVVGDPGGYSAGYAATYASMVGYRNATGQGGTFDYDITGSFEDWSYSKAGVPSMVIELGSYGYHNFSYHRAAIEAMLR